MAIVRYQRDHPGELLHFDIVKLGRIVRPSHLVTVDVSRIAFAQILPDERKSSALSFLPNALAYFASLGIKVQRLMTDNGSASRSRLFAAALRELHIRHLFTKPYPPKTNGKAERFIQTSLRE